MFKPTFSIEITSNRRKQLNTQIGKETKGRTYLREMIPQKKELRGKEVEVEEEAVESLESPGRYLDWASHLPLIQTTESFRTLDSRVP